MKKADRQKVFEKFGGRCAYTGKELPEKWEIDHVEPKSSWKFQQYDNDLKRIHDPNSIDNLVPALKIVNHYKRGKDLEMWRTFLLKLHIRLKKMPKKTRVKRTEKRKAYLIEVASHFGITVDKPFNGIFYFETLTNQTHEN